MTRRTKFRLPSRHAVAKRLYQSLSFARSGRQDILFIFGCQRSGTTMFADAFRADMNSWVFGERGLNDDGETRLPGLETVRTRLEKRKAGLRVAKPLVESQRAGELLDYFPDAKAVWMFRNYADVARSAARRFSREAPYRNLRPIVDPSLPRDFTSEIVSPETAERVREHFSEEMAKDSAQALYWYVRNIRYFEQALDQHARVLLCSYENFLREPAENMARVYAFLDRPFPGSRIVAHISENSSAGMPEPLALPDGLADLCDGLLNRLRQSENDQARSLAGKPDAAD